VGSDERGRGRISTGTPAVDRALRSSLRLKTNYLYDRARLVEEVDNSRGLIARHTQGKSIDEPLAQVRPGTTSATDLL
jgi:hypothetical protein